MPPYSKKIENSPGEVKRTEIEVEGDYLTNLTITFPHGCCGLMDVAILYGDEQIFPQNKGEYYSGDGETIKWEGLYRLPEKPCTFVIYTYNQDDTYNHMVFVRMVTKYEYELLEFRIAKALRVQQGGLLTFLSKLFGR